MGMGWGLADLNSVAYNSLTLDHLKSERGRSGIWAHDLWIASPKFCQLSYSGLLSFVVTENPRLSEVTLPRDSWGAHLLKGKRPEYLSVRRVLNKQFRVRSCGFKLQIPLQVEFSDFDTYSKTRPQYPPNLIKFFLSFTLSFNKN